MTNIPWYGWVLLIFLVLFFVAVNISLIGALRNRKQEKIDPDQPVSKKKSTSTLHRLGEAIKDPWKVEDEMLAELSRRTNELRTPSKSPGDSGDQVD
jgi:Na+-transporting methylmalonyl-CoA/oxaloacetate decarboxylase gamma subunit